MNSITLAWTTRILGVLMVATLAAGCSVRRMAMNQVANALAGTGTTFAGDDDPELVREAIPFGLKTMEALLADLPRHRGLLLALASGFTQYAYAFVLDEAEEIEPKDFERAKALRARALKLFLRARDYGLRGLEVGHNGFGKRLRADPKTAVKAATRDDVPLLYWTAAAWSMAVSIAKNNQELMAELPAAAALAERALALDEAWDHGALHEFFISYDGSRAEAMGGSKKRAREHFHRAIELSGGLKASPYVSLAESVTVAEQKRDEFNTLLDQALAIDPEKKPEWRLLNLVTQRKARRLKARAEDLFP
ncbi:MAG: TRAP transporter TatT component family protein [Verrucomicrobiae bacterium]|nr:TRAP transporter TatT component family protein [Verrucomicrobiae bacterium]